MLSCNLSIVTYSLPAAYYAFANLVALFKHTIKQPVTLGSSVPEWPVFSTLRILLTHATTSWEEGFEGLSRLIKEYFKCSSKGLKVGE